MTFFALLRVVNFVLASTVCWPSTNHWLSFCTLGKTPATATLESKKDDKAESETQVEFIMLPLVLFLVK